MFRKLPILKDTYVTNKYIDGVPQTGSNVGLAGTLDLYKLYGQNGLTGSAGIELTRILLGPDYSAIFQHIDDGDIDVNSPNFKCFLSLQDVYGGQTTPRNFTIVAAPLSHSWDEGTGLDTIYYSHSDAANYLTASTDESGTPVPWFGEGASVRGAAGAPGIDVITSAAFGNTECKQTFRIGDEDLKIDITKLVSGTYTGNLPDHGIALYLSSSHETDDHSYFVKRFGSAQSLDPQKRPTINMHYDTSDVVDSQFYFGTPFSLQLKNYRQGTPVNLVGASGSYLTGSACLSLELSARLSSGAFSTSFSGSQFTTGGYMASGTVLLTNTNLLSEANASGSITFDYSWKEANSTLVFSSGTLDVQSQAASNATFPRRISVNIANITKEYQWGNVIRPLVFLQDMQKPYVRSLRVPLVSKTLNVETHFSVRNAHNNEVVIPFDTEFNSTRLSCDGEFLYFDLWVDSLPPMQSYVIDIMVIDGGRQQVFRNASAKFRVVT
jgi:hypothetical protein